MAETLALTRPSSRLLSPVARVRIATILVLLAVWEALARSGLLYEDVVPSLIHVAGGLVGIVTDPEFYGHLGVTAYEIGFALVLGGTAGLLVGLAIGSRPLFGRTTEPLIHYLGPTPKIIFFPLLIMMFGIGSGSKIAMGTISTFFPIALSVAAGMREIDPVLIRVGRSFRASPLQMTTKIYLPAMREPLVTGLRLAFGVSVIGVLLAETKFARNGLGFMVTQFYQRFDMPALYGLVIMIFALAITINGLIGRLSRTGRS